MAINTSNPNGVTVESAAKDSSGSASTLSIQTSAASNEVIVPDAITANNEGNLESSPSYVGRLIQIREGATGVATVTINNGGTSWLVGDVLEDDVGTHSSPAFYAVTSESGGVITGLRVATPADTNAVAIGAYRGEYSVEGSLTNRATKAASGFGSGATVDVTFQSVDEYRYVTGVASNTLTVHEDWTDGPVAGNNWRISYLLDDVATVTGLNLINKRLSDYSSSRRLTVASGGWLAFLNGVSLETVDNSSTVTADFTVSTTGRFDSGYTSNGVPVSGGYVIGTPAVSGELVFVAAGGANAVCNLYDTFWTNVVDNAMRLESPGTYDSLKIFRPEEILFETGTPQWFTQVKNTRIGRDQTSKDNRSQIGNSADFENCVHIGAQCALLSRTTSRSADIGGRRIVFVNNEINAYDASYVTNSEFNAHILVTPSWDIDPDFQDKLRFFPHAEGGTGQVLSNDVFIEAHEFEITVQDDSGSAITDAAFHVVEEDVTSGIVSGTSSDGTPDTTDTNGQFTDDLWAIIYRDQVKSGGASFGPDITNGITVDPPSSQTKTIDRLDGGSFITDGFAVGNSLRISYTNTTSAVVGTHTITNVAAGTLTVDDPMEFNVGGDVADTAIVLTEVDLNAETRGNFAFRAYSYGKIPYLFGQPVLTDTLNLTATLPDDPNITEASQATAISNGAGIIVERYPTPVRGPFNIQTNVVESPGGTTVDIASYAIPSGLNDSMLVVVASMKDTTNSSVVTGVDFGPGVDALTSAIATTDATDDLHTSTWYLLNPAAATRTIRVTFGNSSATDIMVRAFYLTNVDQATPVDQTDGNNDFTPPNDALAITPSTSNSMAIAAFHSNAGNPNTTHITKTEDAVKVGANLVTTGGDPQAVWSKILPDTSESTFWVQWPFRNLLVQIDGVANVVNFETSGDTFPVKVFNYDAGTGGLPTIGETITINNAGADATGTLHEYIGDAVSGTLVLTDWAGKDWRQIGNDLNIAAVGRPALAALSPTRVAFIDGTNEDLRTYEFDGTDWSQIGSDLNISGTSVPALAALSPTRVAFIDDTNEDLRTYEFDGTDWFQVGNDLNISSINISALAALSDNRVAFIDFANRDLRTYDFDGTDWRQIGNDLNIAAVGTPALAALSSTRVAFIDDTNEDLRTYEFDGTDWSQIGSDLNIPSINLPDLAALSPTRVAFIDDTNDDLRTYDFDGTNWSQTGNDLNISGTSIPALAALSDNRVAFIDDTNEDLRTYKWGAPDNINITGGTSTFDATTHTSGAGSFDEEYTWLVDCNGENMTVVYDYLAAKMAQTGADLDSEFREVIIWGEDEQSQLVYSDGSAYTTERNVNRAEGVWLSNRGAGSITYMTSDTGKQFVPPVTINLTFSGLKDNTEVRVCDFTTDLELAGTEAATTGTTDDRSVTFALTAGTVVNIRFAHGTAGDGRRYTVPDRNSILNFTWPSADATLPITQVLDRNYSNP